MIQEIEQVLRSMHATLNGLLYGSDVEHEGDSGSLDNDEELRADRVLGELSIELLSRSPRIISVEVEGLGITEVNPHGMYHAKVDPLDASLNYKNRGYLSGLFPYGGVITIVNSVDSPTFADVLYAGVMNFASYNQDCWLGDVTVTTVNGEIARPYKGELDLTKIAVIGEFYYPDTREKLVRAFEGQKGYLRNPGSSAIEMACVSSGQAAAFICGSQKGHELGAAYRLVMSAGGVVCDWDGRPYYSKPYVFNSQYPVIVAASQQAADWVLELLRKND